MRYKCQTRPDTQNLYKISAPEDKTMAVPTPEPPGPHPDVHHVETTQPTEEKWSPRHSSIAALSIYQPHPGENMDSDEATRIHPSFSQSVDGLNGPEGENAVLDPVLVMGHQSNLGFAPQNSIGYQNMDSLEVSIDDLGRQEVDSAYSSVSHIEEESPHLMGSPPSPSTSSMETDVGVDPETGERAME